MVAGALVLLPGVLGWTQRLAAWLPGPVVFGVLAGGVLPFLTGLFDAFGDLRLVVGPTLFAYLAVPMFINVRAAITAATVRFTTRPFSITASSSPASPGGLGPDHAAQFTPTSELGWADSRADYQPVLFPTVE